MSCSNYQSFTTTVESVLFVGITFREIQEKDISVGNLNLVNCTQKLTRNLYLLTFKFVDKLRHEFYENQFPSKNIVLQDVK